MTNREWLNTLSDEERKMRELNKFEELVYCYYPLSKDGVLSSFKLLLEWLSQPHETTADEDASKIGWNIRIVDDEIVLSNWNIRGCDAYYGLKEDGTERVTLLNISKTPQIDIPVGEIRTIADKKRKELGWK